MNIILLLISSIMPMFLTICRKYLANENDFSAVLLLISIMVCLFFIISYIILNTKNGNLDMSKYISLINNKNIFFYIIIYSIIVVLYSYLHFFLIKNTDISTYIPLRNVIYLIGIAIYGVYYLGENGNGYKKLGIILAIISILLINYSEDLPNLV